MTVAKSGGDEHLGAIAGLTSDGHHRNSALTSDAGRFGSQKTATHETEEECVAYEKVASALNNLFESGLCEEAEAGLECKTALGAGLIPVSTKLGSSSNIGRVPDACRCPAGE